MILACLGATTAGCAGAGGPDAATSDDATGTHASALGYATPPAPKPRFVIRTSTPGCLPIPGTGGAWTGQNIAYSIGVSTLLCSYAWTAAGKNASPDWTVLHAAASTDQVRKIPYVVADVRTSHAPAGAIVPEEITSFTFQPLSPPGGGFGGATHGSFTLGGATVQAGRRSVGGLTAETRVYPEGMSGCEVCGEELGDSLLFVLPPEAMDAPSATLVTEEGSYDLGPISQPVFYAPTPPAFTGWFYVSWF